MQLGHAGRKGSTRLMGEGRDEPLRRRQLADHSASPLAFLPQGQVPRAMTAPTWTRCARHFVRRAPNGGSRPASTCSSSTWRTATCCRASSRRSPIGARDEYGGTLEAGCATRWRSSTPCARAWPAHKPISVRISATDWVSGGFTGEDAVVVAGSWKRHGCDIVDVSAGQTTSFARPGLRSHVPDAVFRQIRNEAGVATMAVGNIMSADQVNSIVASGVPTSGGARPPASRQSALDAARRRALRLAGATLADTVRAADATRPSCLAERANADDAQLRAASRPATTRRSDGGARNPGRSTAEKVA